MSERASLGSAAGQGGGQAAATARSRHQNACPPGVIRRGACHPATSASYCRENRVATPLQARVMRRPVPDAPAGLRDAMERGPSRKACPKLLPAALPAAPAPIGSMHQCGDRSLIVRRSEQAHEPRGPRRHHMRSLGPRKRPAPGAPAFQCPLVQDPQRRAPPPPIASPGQFTAGPLHHPAGAGTQEAAGCYTRCACRHRDAQVQTCRNRPRQAADAACAAGRAGLHPARRRRSGEPRTCGEPARARTRP
jgi:hypothetical protein